MLVCACGLPRLLTSTDVDQALLDDARRREGAPDSVVLDEGPGHAGGTPSSGADRPADAADAADAADDERPLSEPDEWGGLAGLREAAGSS